MTGMALEPNSKMILAREGGRPATAEVDAVRGALGDSILFCGALAPYASAWRASK